MSASTSVCTTPVFWERLWRSSGNQSVGLFIIAYLIYGYQPQVGASADALVAFYDGDRTRILIAAVFSGFAVLNLMWFAAALRTTLADAGQDGWGAAATASSAALGGLFLLLVTTTAALAYSIASAGNHALTSGLNDFAWASVRRGQPAAVGLRLRAHRSGHAAPSMRACRCSRRAATRCEEVGHHPRLPLLNRA
jgi:hypothetical protein